MRKQMIQQCDHCSKDIIVNSDWPNRRFCNRTCYDNYRSDVIRNRSGHCKCCDGEIVNAGSRRRVYCSKECKENLAAENCLKNCQVCGVLFSAIKWARKGHSFRYIRDKTKRCCSRGCLSSFMKTDEDRKRKVGRSGSEHPNWAGGSHRGGKRGTGWEKIAERCREIHGRLCKRCGMTEEENGRKLDVNHITPFHQHKNKTAANKKSNLEPLCRSCHTKTDWEYRKSNPMQVCLDIFS